jgi:hypothetical protein
MAVSFISTAWLITPMDDVKANPISRRRLLRPGLQLVSRRRTHVDPQTVPK